ncbi:MAG: ribonuclease protein component [Fusobacteriaceae bacterium]|jgi:ribonuclease P protein component|nr:ribonuclease protein component [Fusobacteriales bacterium]MDN5303843.1 ribonuclease protein component [Fusobacteriaceae bacterium]
MEKIKKNSEFQNIYSKGKKFYSYYLLMYTLENNLNKKRFGIVVSKKNGNAVCRNRIKRLIRESIRLNLMKFKDNYDYIIIAKKNAGNNIEKLNLKIIEKDLIKIINRNLK